MTDYLELDTSSAAQMQTNYTYNSLGLVSGILYIDTAPTTPVTKESYTYTYDERGYILTETLNTNYSGTNTVSKSYTYDGIGRLETSTEGSTTTTYTYDAAGNLNKTDDGTDVTKHFYNRDAWASNKFRRIYDQPEDS